MDDEGLFPCPFCGSDNLETVSDLLDELSTHWVECAECASRGPAGFTKNEAILYFAYPRWGVVA